MTRYEYAGLLTSIYLAALFVIGGNEAGAFVLGCFWAVVTVVMVIVQFVTGDDR